MPSLFWRGGTINFVRGYLFTHLKDDIRTHNKHTLLKFGKSQESNSSLHFGLRNTEPVPPARGIRDLEES